MSNEATAHSEPHTIVPPNTFFACLIDISEHCGAEFLERCGGKVYLSGFFDDSVNTYLCSMTPSVFVEMIGLVPERYPEDEALADALNNELLEGSLDDEYHLRSDIDRMRTQKLEGLDFEDEDPSEVVREYLQGNPVF